MIDCAGLCVCACMCSYLFICMGFFGFLNRSITDMDRFMAYFCISLSLFCFRLAAFIFLVSRKSFRI